MEHFWLKWLVAIALSGAGFFASGPANATDCYDSSILAPSPFMGNHDEVFQLAGGTIWQVKYEYEYLYEYYPSVVICPSSGRLIIDDKVLNVIQLSRLGAPLQNNGRSNTPTQGIVVMHKVSGCDYFAAYGPTGYYVLEWYGGHDPDEGDQIAGTINGYGFKDVFYLNRNSNGRVWVEDYMLSVESAARKISEKCG